jgi:hypothetical protein
MAATPADIAKYTTDGTLLTAPSNVAISEAIKANHIDARSGEDREIEMFYDVAADGQAALEERFTFLSIVNPVHLGIEVEEALDLGGAIAIAPAVPRFTIVDDTRNLTTTARLRGYAYDMGTDRFSVEVLS